MKKYKKGCASLNLRIASIALVTMLATTTLWAKPKNAVEYMPFKSENSNATVFECEYIEGCSRLSLYYSTNGGEFEYSPVAIYGWRKKKGGWEKLGEYKSSFWDKTILDDDCYKYTHYALEFEAPENTMVLSAEKYDYDMKISLCVSEEYKKMLSEKKAEQERLEKEAALKELFNKYKSADTELKKKSKGYEFHGISEYYKTYRLLKGKSLTNGHAYTSKLQLSNNFSQAEFYEREFIYNSSIDMYKGSVYLQYADNKLREQIVLLERNYNEEVWFCYTPNSSGGITILGFTVTKDHKVFYGASEKNLSLYAEWLSQGN